MSFNLDNYTTVDQRILDFYTQHPAGVITTQPAKVVEVGGKVFVSVIARVYLDRHMEDAPITEAEAWEPYPGTTPYTRDSEMMNCATSAIGRALMQLGIGIKPGALASRDEVKVARERQGEYRAPADTTQARGEARRNYPANDKQKGLVRTLAHKAGTSLDIVIDSGDADRICGRQGVTLNNLTSNDIDALVTAFKAFQQQAKPALDDPWAGETLA